MKINLGSIFILFILFSCGKENSETVKQNSQTIIEGEISNLPDGILYLYKDFSNNKIDSAHTVDGKFTLKHSWKHPDEEASYLGIDHIDKNGVLRAFNFQTNSKFKKSSYNSQFFFSDSMISINGIITDFNQTGFKLSDKIKLVVSPKIKAGYQTNALFNIDGDLFFDINKNSYKKVKNKIKEFPNSFHLLYQINNTRNSFSPEQIHSFLNTFKGEITDSNTFKNLKDYNEKRFNKKKLTVPLLANEKGKKTEVLDSKFEKHLVVFWASWCGPCRQEIPALKKMYPKYNDKIEFVSITTDANNSLWQKALEKENMSWKQLIVNEKSNEYEPIEILFQLSSSIPYVALVDNNMKVLKSHVGLMTEIELENFLKN